MHKPLTVKDLQRMKVERSKPLMDSIRKAIQDGSLKQIAPAKPVPLTHEELPIHVIETMLRNIGPDNLTWQALNKQFYPNRKPHELLCHGYLIKYKWHKKKMYVVEVTAKEI